MLKICSTCLHQDTEEDQHPCNACTLNSIGAKYACQWEPQMSKHTTLAQQYPHYHKKIPEGVKTVDVYRVLQLFEVTDPCLQHAIKKLLCAGARGAKNADKDVEEAAASIRRYQEMRVEEKK